MIRSIKDIVDFLREQANARAPENDERGCILAAVDCLKQELEQVGDWTPEQVAKL